MKRLFVYAFLLLGIFLVGCVKDDNQDNYTFEQLSEMKLYEPMDLDHVRIDFTPLKVSLKKCDLYFDSNINKDTRIAYVRIAEKMLAKAKVSKRLTYYISDQFSNRVTEGIIYLNYSDSFETQLFLVVTLQSKYGVVANYGLL